MSPCPLCSFYRNQHPEMLADALAIPIVVKNPKGKVYLLGPCAHIKENFGPHEDEEMADVAWEGAVIDLQRVKEERRKNLDEIFERIALTHASDRVEQPA